MLKKRIKYSRLRLNQYNEEDFDLNFEVTPKVWSSCVYWLENSDSFN